MLYHREFFKAAWEILWKTISHAAATIREKSEKQE